MRRGLIVGIDPGVTTAAVILGLDGKLIEVRSKKFFSFNEIISCLSATGEPVIVSSDVNPPPKLVQRVASAFGARLHYPPQIMAASKKLLLGKSISQKLNDHERDAYAAAITAFERFEEDFDKIDALAGASSADADKAKSMLAKEGVSVKEAVNSAALPNASEAKEKELDTLRKTLEGREREIGTLRRALNFYKAALSEKGRGKRRETVPGPVAGGTIRLEREARINKERADKMEESLRGAKKLFGLFLKQRNPPGFACSSKFAHGKLEQFCSGKTSFADAKLAGWVPALVAKDFRKESLRMLENYDAKDEWIIFLSNSGISRDALSALESKGVQGIVCENNKIVKEFKTLTHLELAETDFEYSDTIGAINPASMKSDMESVKSDFIRWARMVSDA